MKEQVRNFIDGVKNIPLLSDESFRNGGYSGIDDRSALHFLIYPFVGALGYSIFRPDELKLGYEVEGNVADLALFDSGSVLASFRILSLGEFPRLGDLGSDELDRELGVLNRTGAVLSVLTNGLDYRVFVEDAGQFEELIHFNLFDVVSDESVGIRVSGLLMKSEIVTEIGTRRLFEEKVMLSKLEGEHFLSSRFMVEVLRQELTDVSDSLLKVLVGRLSRTFGVSVDESWLMDRVGSVLVENEGSLERTFEALLGEYVVGGRVVGNSEDRSVAGAGDGEVREVEVIKEVEVVRELTDEEKETLVADRLAERLEEAERELVGRLEVDIRSLLEEEYQLKVDVLEESIEERVERLVMERLAEVSHNEDELRQAEDLRKETDLRNEENLRREFDLRGESSGTFESESAGLNLNSILNKFETDETEVVTGHSDSGANFVTGSGTGVGAVGAGYDDWTKPDYGDSGDRGVGNETSEVESDKEESKEEATGSDKGSGGSIDLNSLLGL